MKIEGKLWTKKKKGKQSKNDKRGAQNAPAEIIRHAPAPGQDGLMLMMMMLLQLWILIHFLFAALSVSPLPLTL